MNDNTSERLFITCALCAEQLGGFREKSLSLSVQWPSQAENRSSREAPGALGLPASCIYQKSHFPEVTQTNRRFKPL